MKIEINVNELQNFAEIIKQVDRTTDCKAMDDAPAQLDITIEDINRVNGKIKEQLEKPTDSPLQRLVDMRKKCESDISISLCMEGDQPVYQVAFKSMSMKNATFTNNCLDSAINSFVDYFKILNRGL